MKNINNIVFEKFNLLLTKPFSETASLSPAESSLCPQPESVKSPRFTRVIDRTKLQVCGASKKVLARRDFKIFKKLLNLIKI